MSKGIRDDLRKRLTEAHERGLCLTPASQTEAHRLLDAYHRGDVCRPANRVYALPEVWNAYDPYVREWQKLRALAKLHPDWVFADVSAAVLHGLDVSYELLGIVHLARGRNSHTRDSAFVRNHYVHGDKPVLVGNARVTSLIRTVYDCTRAYPFPHALGMADSALRISGARREFFTDAFAGIHKNHRDFWRASETMAWADGRAENGGESYARAIMIQQGFLLPQLQIEIGNAVDSGQTFRVDFYWEMPNAAIAGELDGHEKYVNPQMTKGRDIVEVLTDERLRESRMTAKVKVMRFSFADVRNTGRFCAILSGFGIPRGYSVPRVALV